jgi:hypothetical protein
MFLIFLFQLKAKFQELAAMQRRNLSSWMLNAMVTYAKDHQEVDFTRTRSERIRKEITENSLSALARLLICHSNDGMPMEGYYPSKSQPRLECPFEGHFVHLLGNGHCHQ